MNMTGWLSIALACAFGSIIGTLTALEISARLEYGSYLWSIGALVGGIAAYVAIDFRHFCAGVAHSYRCAIAWRPYGLWWKALATISGGIALIYWWIVVVGGAAAAYVSGAPVSAVISTLYVLVASVFGSFFGGLIVCAGLSGAKDAADREWQLHSIIKIGWSFITLAPARSVSLKHFCTRLV